MLCLLGLIYLHEDVFVVLYYGHCVSMYIIKKNCRFSHFIGFHNNGMTIVLVVYRFFSWNTIQQNCVVFGYCFDVHLRSVLWMEVELGKDNVSHIELIEWLAGRNSLCFHLSTLFIGNGIRIWPIVYIRNDWMPQFLSIHLYDLYRSSKPKPILFSILLALSNDLMQVHT